MAKLSGRVLQARYHFTCSSAGEQGDSSTRPSIVGRDGKGIIL